MAQPNFRILNLALHPHPCCQVVFTTEEVAAIKHASPPGMTLLGFKDKDLLKDYHQVCVCGWGGGDEGLLHARLLYGQWAHGGVQRVWEQPRLYSRVSASIMPLCVAAVSSGRAQVFPPCNSLRDSSAHGCVCMCAGAP